MITSVHELVMSLIERAREQTTLFAPQWEDRKDVSKTLISISSAIQVFTITFSSTVITRDTPPCWRFAVLICWSAFICSLVLSLLFLWRSIGLRDLPALVASKYKQFEQAAEAGKPTFDTEPIHRVFDEAFDAIVRKDKSCRRLFTASVICFGVGLAVFTAVGMHQLTAHP
jgi:hypothetical protein